MPISYDIYNNGHFIHAVASGMVTADEIVAYEIAHAIDERIKPPVYELLEIRHGACQYITKDDLLKVLACRKEVKKPPEPHSCAIVVSLGDAHAWDLARFYEGMVRLHYPKNVIVFGDLQTARIWLGVEDVAPPPSHHNAK